MFHLLGFCKFGLYDLLKGKIGNVLESNGIASYPKLPVLIASSAVAEIVACIFLCPMEATRIYMVTNSDKISVGMIGTMKLICKTEGEATIVKYILRNY